MNHKKCLPLSSEGDDVYIAASAEPWPDAHTGCWWMTYRLQKLMVTSIEDLMKQAGRLSMFTPVRLEISRIIPSKLSDMLGQTIENVPRFKMIFEEGNVLYSVKFSSDSSTPNSFGTDEEFEIYNPRRIYDYTEPQANG